MKFKKKKVKMTQGTRLDRNCNIRKCSCMPHESMRLLTRINYKIHVRQNSFIKKSIR